MIPAIDGSCPKCNGDRFTVVLPDNFLELQEQRNRLLAALEDTRRTLLKALSDIETNLKNFNRTYER